MSNNKKHNLLIPWDLIITFILLAIVLCIGGYYLYSIQKVKIKSEIYEQLSTIAKLKTNQIENWRNERFRDADEIQNNLSLIYDVKHWLQNEMDFSAKQRIQSSLESMCKDSNYSNIYLFDMQFNPKLRINVNDEMDPNSINVLGHIKKKPVVQLTDLHKSPFSNDIHLNLMIPLLIHEKKSDILIAVLNIRVEPKKYLFPLIKEWPAESKSAESLLIRKEGNNVLFLNELRHKKNTSLSYQIPLSDTLTPAVKAALGYQGIMEGVDYRDVEVLADIHKISMSNWYIISKVDVDEIMAPLKETAIRTFGYVVLLVITLGVVFLMIWRHQRAEFYKEKYKLEIEKKVLQTHFEYLIKHANDIILLINKDGKIIDVNEKAILTYGFSKQEFQGLSISALREDKNNYYLNKDSLKNGFIFETNHVKKDGSKLPVEVSSRLIEIEGNEYYQNIIRDITERKKAEEKIERLNKMYAFLSQVNQSIVRTAGKENLYSEVCAVAIKFGKFDFAWFGSVNYEQKNITPVIVSEPENELLKSNISLVDEDSSILSNAISNQKIMTCNDTELFRSLTNDIMFQLPNIYRSIAITPIILKGKIISVFVLYSTTPNYFDEEQTRLLEEIGMDISYALENFTEAEKRKVAEETLQSERNLLRAIIEHIPILFYFKDTDARYVINNRAHLNSLGIKSQEDTLGKNVFDFHPQEYAQRYHFDEMQLLRSGQPIYNKEELAYYPKESENRWHLSTLVPVNDSHNNMIGFVGLAQDITERKKSELALKESEEFNKSLLKTIPFGMNIVDENGEILFLNDNFEKYFTSNVIGEKCWTVYRDDKTQCQECPLKSQIEIGETKISEASDVLNGKVFQITHTGMMFHGKKAILEIFQDITERKLIETKLRENQKLLSTVIENMPVGVFLTDSHGNILHGNSAAQKIWAGIRYVGTNKYNEYKAWFVKSGKLVEPNDWPVTRVLRTGNSILNEEIEIESFDGTHKFINNSAVPIFSSRKEITGAVIVNQDITERKRAEEALLYEQSLVNALMDNSPDHIYFKDRDSRFIRLNKEQAARFGSSNPADIVGKSDFDFFSEQHARQAYEDEQAIMNEGSQIIALEEKETWPDGRVTWVSSTKMPLKDKNDKIIGTFGISRDITKSKLAEEALKDSEEKFRSFAEESPNMIFINKGGRIVYVNQKCVDLMGYSREEFYSPSFDFLNLIAQEHLETAKVKYKKLIENKEQIAYEYTLITKDNKRIDALHAFKLIQYDGGEALMGNITDITERKKMENELKLAKEKAETANKLKSEFLAQMSHEIRSPMNVTLSFVNLIKDEVGGNLPANLLQYFDGVDLAGKRLIRTVDLILNMSEMQIGVYEPNWNNFDLQDEILNQLYLEYNGQAKQKSLEFSLLNKAFNPNIYADKYSVNQIFANLIDNAIKYTERGKIEVILENDNENNVIVSVKDTGIGISESFMNNIFDLFMQEERGYSRRYEGNGLGLALVKKYCDMNKATINVESLKGIGSTFKVKLTCSQKV
jgi:PAS domain S-box-containing protein